MYPRNNASPERLAIGQVILISDGTIQTSAVVITVRGQGGAEATGGGTTAYGAEGTVYYTPTQAETNFTSFTVIASKASCFSASLTVVTTASSTAGQVDVKSVAGTAQTANDNGADINAILLDTAEIGAAGAGLTALATQASVDVIDANVDQIETAVITNAVGADISADIATAQTDLDTITGADGAALASTQQSITFQPITITAGDAIPNVTFAGTGTEDGISFERAGSGDMYDAVIMAQLNAEMDTALTDYDAATGTELAATEAKIDIIDTNVDAVLVDTGTTIPAQITALNDISVADVLTTQMTEAYAADGTAPTLAEAIFLINSVLNEFSITGTTITSYKLDGTTVASTHTLDSATVPTSRTRSS